MCYIIYNYLVMVRFNICHDDIHVKMFLECEGNQWKSSNTNLNDPRCILVICNDII